MKNLKNAGRVIFGLPFIIFGLNHFKMGSQMAGYVPSFIPGGVFWIYLVGLALVLAGISIIIKKYIRLSATLLGIMLAIFILTIHLPGLFNPAIMQMEFANLLKDTSLCGAAFFIAGSFPNEEKKSE